MWDMPGWPGKTMGSSIAKWSALHKTFHWATWSANTTCGPGVERDGALVDDDVGTAVVGAGVGVCVGEGTGAVPDVVGRGGVLAEGACVGRW